MWNSQCEFAVWLKELKPGLCDNPEGWNRVGRRFKREEMYSYLWLLQLMYGRNQHNILRQLSFNLEKEMATHSSILAWRIPWTEEPGRLQPMGSQRVGHNWATFTILQLKRNQFKNNKVPHKNEKCLVFLLKTKGTFWPAQ